MCKERVVCHKSLIFIGITLQLKKNKNNKAYLKFLLAQFHTCTIFNAAGSKKKKHFYLGPSIILLNEDTKMWKIHLNIPEIFVILQLKK